MAIMNNDAIYMEMQISLQNPDFNYFVYILNSRINGSYGDFILIFDKIFQKFIKTINLQIKEVQ
jgi:hypothetical protein